jgi:hypothetical protein
MSATQIAEQSPQGQPFGWTDAPGEFDYHPMPVLIPVAAAFAFLSLTAFVMDWLLLVPAVGIVLAAAALWQIRRSGGAYGGRAAAWALIGVMAAEFAGAASLYGYSFATEVPEGFQRVNFTSEISKYELKTVNGEMQIPEAVQKLNDQPVFLKGYMYPTKEVHGLKHFVLCKDMGQCCFGGKPKATDMIVINMDGNHTVNHRTGMVSVAGIFRTQANVGAADLQPVYQLDCSYFSVAKTSY